MSTLSPNEIKKIGLNKVQLDNVHIDSKNKLIHSGYLSNAPILNESFAISDTSLEFFSVARKKAVQQLASKVRLVATTDLLNGSPNGEFGIKIYNELKKKIIDECMKETKLPTVKPLPVPQTIAQIFHKKRGGRREKRKREHEELNDLEKKQLTVRLGVNVEKQQEDLKESRLYKATLSKLIFPTDVPSSNKETVHNNEGVTKEYVLHQLNITNLKRFDDLLELPIG